MKKTELQSILDIGIALSAEKDYNRLLERILADAMSLMNCDAGTLYLKDGDFLHFKIMRNDTLKIYEGGDGCAVSLPPVPITRKNVCTIALLENRTICIDDVRQCREYDLSGPIRYDAMTGYYTQSILVVPLRDRTGERIGVLQMINARDEAGENCAFSPDRVIVIESIASQAAVCIQNMRYLEEIRGLFHSFVRVVTAAIDERTPYNVSHTMHMAEYGNRFIGYLNKVGGADSPYYFTEKEKEELLMSIWLHDIGKLVTPLEVMNKASRLLPEQRERIFNRIVQFRLQNRINRLEGRLSAEEEQVAGAKLARARTLVEQMDCAGYLTDDLIEELKGLGAAVFSDGEGNGLSLFTELELDLLTIRKGTLSEEERSVMEKHAALTYRFLSEIQFPEEYRHVKSWASSHHEYLNGTGYPQKLESGQIPREVRIITILDIFDALTAGDRPYKKGMPAQKALSILEVMAEKEGKLDPELTRLFTESECWEPVRPAGTEVKNE